jgi:CDP-4-dehydro-6-deoxyglucose reductase
MTRHSHTKAVLYQHQILPGNIIILQISPEHWIDYQAGQYLAVEYQGTDYFYSIANAPDAKQKIYELHIRLTSGAKRWLENILEQKEINIHLPYGKCCIENIGLHRPLILIAGGMGFAPIKAILDSLAMQQNFHLPVELYWSGRNQVDFYMEEKIDFWKNSLNLKYHKWYDSTENQQDLAGYLLNQDGSLLKRASILIAGPFDMAIAFRDKFVQNGVNVQSIYSDAFEYLN